MTSKRRSQPSSSQDRSLPRRKHLRRLDRVLSRGAPVFFITICVRDRRPLLIDPRVAEIVVAAFRGSRSDHGWMLGRYVVMPDHVHFFASPTGDEAKSLSSFVGFWKRGTAAAIRCSHLPGFAWQAEFFDHLLRRNESYSQKWEYVRMNPVRAGLVSRAEDWPYQGEVEALDW